MAVNKRTILQAVAIIDGLPIYRYKDIEFVIVPEYMRDLIPRGITKPYFPELGEDHRFIIYPVDYAYIKLGLENPD